MSRRVNGEGETSMLVSGETGGREEEHPYMAWWHSYKPFKFEMHHLHMWNFQHALYFLSVLYFTVVGAFDATEVGGFNAFSEFCLMIMHFIAAAVAGCALIWSFICFIINICGDEKRPRCPPMHRTVFGWCALNAAWWVLSVYFFYQWKNRTTEWTQAQQNEWHDLTWAGVLVAFATVGPYWSFVLDLGANFMFWGCGVKNVHMRMLW